MFSYILQIFNIKQDSFVTVFIFSVKHMVGGRKDSFFRTSYLYSCIDYLLKMKSYNNDE